MKNKNVLITGASSGIGLECAKLFAKNGSNLILFARRLERLEDIKRDLEESYGVQVIIKKVDVRDRRQVTEGTTRYRKNPGR